MWKLTPRNDLLTDYEDSKVFLSADPGRTYVLFFLEGGSASLDLTGFKDNFSLKWINPFTGQWGQTATITGGKEVKISTPDDGSWLLTVVSLNFSNQVLKNTCQTSLFIASTIRAAANRPLVGVDDTVTISAMSAD